MSRLPFLISACFLSTIAVAFGAGGAADSDQGAANIFVTNCGYCHQNGGRDAGGIGPKLMGTARDDDFILDRIRHGYSGKMPAFAGTLDDGQIHALLRYIRNLKPDS
jgi:mono/diheme cytochrome c family protein